MSDFWERINVFIEELNTELTLRFSLVFWNTVAIVAVGLFLLFVNIVTFIFIAYIWYFNIGSSVIKVPKEDLESPHPKEERKKEKKEKKEKKKPGKEEVSDIMGEEEEDKEREKVQKGHHEKSGREEEKLSLMEGAEEVKAGFEGIEISRKKPIVKEAVEAEAGNEEELEKDLEEDEEEEEEEEKDEEEEEEKDEEEEEEYTNMEEEDQDVEEDIENDEENVMAKAPISSSEVKHITFILSKERSPPLDFRPKLKETLDELLLSGSERKTSYYNISSIRRIPKTESEPEKKVEQSSLGLK